MAATEHRATTIGRYWLVAALLASFAAVSGCSNPRVPDLRAVYSLQTVSADHPPVILIHGALGSRLVRSADNTEYWPGGLRRLAFSTYSDLSLPINESTLQPDPDLRFEVAGIAEGTAGRDFYGRIIDTLETVGGFERAEPGYPPGTNAPNYYVFAYDWRQDNVHTVQQLHAFIEQVRTDHDAPDMQVDIIAHSMGGLITRYYARFGTADVLDSNEFPMTEAQGSSIRRAVLLGTPNLGSAGAVRSLMSGHKVVLGTVPPEVVATFPSTYQVLPHALNNWVVTNAGKPLQRDLFDVEFWRRFELSVFSPRVRKRILDQASTPNAGRARIALLERYFARHIERARRFTWSLTVPLEQETVRYIVFGSDCFPTPARLVVEEVDGASALRLWPNQIVNKLPGMDYEKLMFEPGDGTITKASLLARHSADLNVARHRFSNFAIDYPVFLCERHTGLTGNVNFQNNLLHALLSVDPQ